MPPLEPDVVLRSFTRADTEFFSRLATDGRVTRFVGDGRPWDSGVIASRVDSALGGLPPEHPEARRWFIASLGGEPAGLAVSSRHEEAVEIGYWVAPEHWGRGLAGRMVAMAIPVVWYAYGPVSLSARVEPGNLASVRILARHGFRADGVTPEGLAVYRLDHHSPARS